MSRSPELSLAESASRRDSGGHSGFSPGTAAGALTPAAFDAGNCPASSRAVPARGWGQGGLHITDRWLPFTSPGIAPPSMPTSAHARRQRHDQGLESGPTQAVAGATGSHPHICTGCLAPPLTSCTPRTMRSKGSHLASLRRSPHAFAGQNRRGGAGPSNSARWPASRTRA